MGPLVEPLIPAVLLLLGLALLLRLLFGPTFFAVLAAVVLYDILKLVIFLPFRIGRALIRFGRHELRG